MLPEQPLMWFWTLLLWKFLLQYGHENWPMLKCVSFTCLLQLDPFTNSFLQNPHAYPVAVLVTWPSTPEQMYKAGEINARSEMKMYFRKNHWWHSLTLTLTHVPLYLASMEHFATERASILAHLLMGLLHMPSAVWLVWEQIASWQ